MDHVLSQRPRCECHDCTQARYAETPAGQVDRALRRDPGYQAVFVNQWCMCGAHFTTKEAVLAHMCPGKESRRTADAQATD